MLDTKFKPDGYNIGINCGEAAGQTVFHLHVHLIPRYVGDIDNPRGGVRGVIPSRRTAEEKCSVHFPPGNIGINQFARSINSAIDLNRSRKFTWVEINKQLKKMEY